MAQQEELPIFRAETSLALVRFHVIQKKKYVDRLKPADITLYEDGKARKLTFFEGGSASRRTVPIELLLLFDVSGSVKDEGLLDPFAYKTALLDGLPNVKIAVYSFAGSLQRYCRPTRDTQMPVESFRRLSSYKNGALPRPVNIKLELFPKRKSNSNGGTWIYEAMAGCAKDALATGDNITRMMMVYSDGVSDHHCAGRGCGGRG